MAIVVIRNILLVALLVTALVRIAHARRGTRSAPVFRPPCDLDALALPVPLPLPVTAADSTSSLVPLVDLEEVAQHVMPDRP
jgi:hypothetical protein